MFEIRLNSVDSAGAIRRPIKSVALTLRHAHRDVLITLVMPKVSSTPRPDDGGAHAAIPLSRGNEARAVPGGATRAQVMRAILFSRPTSRDGGDRPDYGLAAPKLTPNDRMCESLAGINCIHHQHQPGDHMGSKCANGVARQHVRLSVPALISASGGRMSKCCHHHLLTQLEQAEIQLPDRGEGRLHQRQQRHEDHRADDRADEKPTLIAAANSTVPDCTAPR
jgi:hypothetical protein